MDARAPRTSFLVELSVSREAGGRGVRTGVGTTILQVVVRTVEVTQNEIINRKNVTQRADRPKVSGQMDAPAVEVAALTAGAPAAARPHSAPW